MKDSQKQRDDIILDLKGEMTSEALDELVRNIRLMPEPPLPNGFVEEAMASWRRAKRVLPIPVQTAPLNLMRMIQILFSQGLWKDMLLGVLLFAIGFFVLTVSDVVPQMLILAVVGCIPLLVVVSNTARHTLCGMGELSRSFRIPMQMYILARLLLAGVVCLLLNELVTIVLFSVWGGDSMLRMALLWCIPTCMNAAAALVLSARIRHFGQLTTVLSMLPFFWLMLLSGQSIAAWTASVDLLWLWGLVVLAIVLLIGAISMNGRYLKKGGYLLGA